MYDILQDGAPELPSLLEKKSNIIRLKFSGWWCGTFFVNFHSVGNFIISDEINDFFRGVGIPPTSS